MLDRGAGRGWETHTAQPAAGLQHQPPWVSASSPQQLRLAPAPPVAAAACARQPQPGTDAHRALEHGGGGGGALRARMAACSPGVWHPSLTQAPLHPPPGLDRRTVGPSEVGRVRPCPFLTASAPQPRGAQTTGPQGHLCPPGTQAQGERQAAGRPPPSAIPGHKEVATGPPPPARSSGPVGLSYLLQVLGGGL